MFNEYTRIPEKLRARQSASHIERAVQREKKPEPQPSPPASSTPSASDSANQPVAYLKHESAPLDANSNLANH
jgi:hypothetical protein